MPDLKSLPKAGALPLLAGLILLVAAWFGWQGWQASSAESKTREMGQVRASSAAQVRSAVEEAVERLEGTRSRIALVTALKRDEDQAARDVVTQGWDGVEAVEWFSPGLDEAYADPNQFGFGKLGVLEQALASNAAHAGIVKDAGGPRLAVAAPVLSDGRVLTLAYVRLPLETVTAPLSAASVNGGYLAIRQGRHTIFETGDTTLAGVAEVGAIPISGTALRVVAAAPVVELGLGAFAYFLLALLAVLVALTLLLMPRLKGLRLARMPEGEAGGAGTPTLAELQQSGQLEVEAEAARAALAVKSVKPPPPKKWSGSSMSTPKPGAATWRCAGAGDRICINHRGAKFTQQGSHRALPAAYTVRQTQLQRHGVDRLIATGQ